MLKLFKKYFIVFDAMNEKRRIAMIAFFLRIYRTYVTFYRIRMEKLFLEVKHQRYRFQEKFDFFFMPGSEDKLLRAETVDPLSINLIHNMT